MFLPGPLSNGHANSNGFVAVPKAVAATVAQPPAIVTAKAEPAQVTIYDLAYEAALAQVIARRVRSARFSIN